MAVVYVTRWALTKGILKMKAKPYLDDPEAVVIKLPGMTSQVVHKPDWHPSLDKAQVAAEEFRDKRVGQVRQALSRIESADLRVFVDLTERA